MFAESIKKVFAQELFEESSTAKERVGELRPLGDGRVFQYCKNGAVALAAGKLVQTAAPASNHKNIAVAVAAAAGATQVSVTLGATAATANQYADGYLHVNDEAGEGLMYKIKTHPAHAGSGTLVVTLYDPIITALTTSSEVTLTANPLSGVVVVPTTGTGAIVGVPPIAVTAAYYFWCQVAGVAPVLTDGTLVIGQHARASDAVAGAVEPLDRDGTAEDEAAVGMVVQVNANTEYSLIKLCI